MSLRDHRRVSSTDYKSSHDHDDNQSEAKYVETRTEDKASIDRIDAKLVEGSESKDDDYSSDDYDYSISDDDDGDYGDDDKDSHQFKANLSEDLRRLLGLIVPVPPSTINKGGETKVFVPPQFYGLGNSAPIIHRTKNDDSISYPFNTLNPFVSKNPFYSSNPFYVNEQETNKFGNFHNGGADDDYKAYDYDDDEEEEDYDNDDDEEEEDDDNDEGALPSSNMSLSLMKALGMDTAGVDEVATDWRPPSRSGLQHSAPIVRPGSRSRNEIDIVPTNDRINRATTFILPSSSKPMSISLMKALGIDTNNNVVQEAKA